MPSKKKNKKVQVTRNGPYIVSGNVPLAKEKILVDEDGEPRKWVKGQSYPREEEYLLCRCGRSKNKPYCDKTHLKVDFDGTETAGHDKYEEQAEKISGPDLDLTDEQDLCVGARFCHRAGGTWKLIKNSDDLESKKIAIEEACDCPSGRLVVWDKKTKKPIEAEFMQSISLVECSGDHMSGPIWLKGGIPLESSDGSEYEIRNRVTLCRCGKSSNKPFCDGTHIEVEFDDGDNSIKR